MDKPSRNQMDATLRAFLSWLEEKNLYPEDSDLDLHVDDFLDEFNGE